ncbi:testis-expressed protein 47-like isoform X2 [Bombyx mandarina]|uniref:Testis-expressed protein 47-like isoform X2 n=1 Tax=Bombyx mandarina TaxID=7092 RepID=A0A6J2K7P6_BOMMA|nr:testis-expressed protein 47-like isoform X2 [Bombyx mandarina]
MTALKKTYAIRMIYIGEHTLSKEEIIRAFEKSVHDVNSAYCEIHVYGLLLVYDSYFVHILEGSEDTLHRHLRFLFKLEIDWIERMKKSTETDRAVLLENKDKSEPKIFRRLKMLMVYHSISTLFFARWRALTAHPPSLVGRLDVNGPISEHMEQLKICLNKITKLCDLLKADEKLSFEGLNAVDPRIESLPEAALLDFLLQSSYIRDLRQTYDLHRRVDDHQFYFESVWPLPTHFTPRLLYKLKVDDSFVEPLPVMPWEIVKKETEDEDREEPQSGSSSSD